MTQERAPEEETLALEAPATVAGTVNEIMYKDKVVVQESAALT